MQQFSHDYAKVAETQNVLFLALEDLRNGHTYEAKRGIMKAREMLDEYLAKDNMIPDNDVADGWVRYSEAQEHTFTNEQLDFIRDLFADQLSKAPASTLAAEELAIINRCQEQLGCPKYESVKQFIANQSGLWTEIEPKALTSSTPRTERHKQIDSRYLEQVKDGADPSNPLYGKVAVMSGTYEQIHMERDQVAAAIQRLGAKLNRSVSRTMQVFVMGNKVGPSKLAEVESLRADGHDIRIISQLEFKEICNKYLKD